MSIKEAHTVVDSIVCKSPRCMIAWSMLSPLLFRTKKRVRGTSQHTLNLALHQISVFSSEYQKTGVANSELLEVAIEILGGSSCKSSSDEDSIETLPPKKRTALRAYSVSVLQ